MTGRLDAKLACRRSSVDYARVFAACTTCQTPEIWLDEDMPVSEPLQARPPGIRPHNASGIADASRAGSEQTVAALRPHDSAAPCCAEPVWSRYSRALFDSAQRGDIEGVRAILQHDEPKALGSAALRVAAQRGHLDIVRMLIPVSDAKVDDSLALMKAATAGHLDIVRELIPISDPQAKNSESLRAAAISGHLDVVRMLIPVSDPKADDSAALRWAASSGHLELVRTLIPVSDVRAKNCEPLRRAAMQGHHELVRELAGLSDVVAVFREQVATARLDLAGTAGRMRLDAAVVAIDTLARYVDDEERDRAIAELPEPVLQRSLNLAEWRAWRAAQNLHSNLRQFAPRTVASRPRPSL